jgi:hypothetical protein
VGDAGGSGAVVRKPPEKEPTGDWVYALGTVTLANSDFVLNNSSISGATTSYGNNRFAGNGPGTAPTPAGGVSTDFAQH